MKLYENNELRKELTRKNILAMNHLKEENLTAEQQTMINNEVDAVMNDEHLLNLHKQAKSIIELTNKQKEVNKATFNEVKEFYKFSTGKELNLNGFERMTYMKMDLSGTPEAKKKNMEYMLSLADKDFATKEFGNIIKRIQNFDFSKTVFNTPEEALNNLDENYEILNYMFVFADGINNGGLKFNEETMDYIKNITKIIQQGGYCKNIMQYYGSSLAITVSDKDTTRAMAVSHKIAVSFGTYKGVIDDVEVRDGQIVDNTTSAAISSGVLLSTIKEAFIGDLPKLYENGTIPKNVINYNAKRNNEIIPLDTALNEMIKGASDIRFEKKPEEELKRLENGLTNTHVKTNPELNKDYLIKQLNNIPEKLTIIENTFNDLKKFQKNLKEANHFYSKNHEEYNNLMGKLNQFLGNEATSYNIPDFKKNVKDIEKLALDYVEAKANQEKNSTRQKRYDNCKDIYQVTQKFENVMKSLEAIPVTDPEIINFERNESIDSDMSFSENELDLDVELENIKG